MDELIADVSAVISDLGLEVEISADTLGDKSSKGDIHVCLSKLAAEIAAAGSALGLKLQAAPGPASPLSSFQLFAISLGSAYALAGSDARSILLTIWALATEVQSLRLALVETARTARVAHAAGVQRGYDLELYLLCRALAVPPGSDEALRSQPQRALAQVMARLERVMGSLPPAALSSTRQLLDGAGATPEVILALTDLNNLLRADYAMRREMLLARLDVTIQSFLWSRKAEGKEEEILATIAHRRKALTVATAAIRPEDAFTAGPELAALHARRVTDTSTRGLRSASVKNVRIGAVPDRGGRVGEMAPSARDVMPAWQARKAGIGSGGGGGGANKSYSKEHEARAVQLLQEAAQFEGEAGAALEERVGDAQDEAGEEASGGRRRGGRGGGGPSTSSGGPQIYRGGKRGRSS